MLKIRYYGDPILRKKASAVKTVDDSIRALVEDMEKAMDHYRGVGLAAPQVGHSLRLFIARIDREEEGKHVRGTRRVFINPILSEPSAEMWMMNEGCLSIPGIREEIERPSFITVEALNEQGQPFKETFSGLLARVIMHENDHINGVLFVDRLSAKQKKALEPQLRHIKKLR